MNITNFSRPARMAMAAGRAWQRRLAWTAVGLLAAANVAAMPTVSTVTGGPSTFSSRFYGYVDGNTATTAQFHTPVGLALDKSQSLLYVADRDNNAIRVLDLANNWTDTFTTDGVNQPVGVAVDSGGNVYVLNQGNGSDGSVLEYDSFGYLIDIKAMNLSNANGIAIDPSTNIFVTVNNSSVIQIAPEDTISTIATIGAPGTDLRGIVVTDSGFLAVCDSGRNGILLINPTDGTSSALAGFNGQGDAFGTKNFAKFFHPLRHCQSWRRPVRCSRLRKQPGQGGQLTWHRDQLVWCQLQLLDTGQQEPGDLPRLV